MADAQQQGGVAVQGAADANNNKKKGGGMMSTITRSLMMLFMFNTISGVLFGSNDKKTNQNDGAADDDTNANANTKEQTHALSRANDITKSTEAPPAEDIFSLFSPGPMVNNFGANVNKIAPYMTPGDLMYVLVEMVEQRGAGEFTTTSTTGGSSDAGDGLVVASATYPLFTSGESLPTPAPADHSDFLNKLIRPYFSATKYEDENVVQDLLRQREALLERMEQHTLRITAESSEDEKERKKKAASDASEKKNVFHTNTDDDDGEQNFFPYSLDIPIRNLTKTLNLTSCYARNCTLIAKVSIFFQHPSGSVPSAAAMKGGRNLHQQSPRRVVTLEVPLITFVEKVDTELVTLLGSTAAGDDGEGSSDAEGGASNEIVIGGLSIPNPGSSTRKKKGGGAVRSRTKRQRNKIDNAIDNALSWARKAVMGGGDEEAEEAEAKKIAVDTPQIETGIKADNVASGDDFASGDEVLLHSSSSAAALAERKTAPAADDDAPKTRWAPHFQPVLTISPVVDFNSYPIANVPPQISRFYFPIANPKPTPAERAKSLLMGYGPHLAGWQRTEMEKSVMSQKNLQSTELYAPIVYVNKFWLLEDHLIPMNQTNVEKIPFTLSIEPLSLMRFILYTQFDDSMRRNEEWGTMSRYDSDMTKKIFLESNILLLIVTMIVSSLHSVFEFLAIKNDVSFWRNRKSFKGLSLRTIAVNLYFQFIIFLYLLDSEETSYMVLIPAGISVFVEGWKLLKTMKIEKNATSGKWTFNFKASYDEQTRTYDQQAMRYLTYLLVPCLAGYSIYSAMNHDHKGWYSFLVGVQVKFIYFSGFIMMTPQIFINYKLKSVTAVPWRTFIYRFLNTIIDDLFAFVITMPTLHRIACFRDDVVFLILLFQRWQYPVDKTRTEDGYKSAEEIAEEEKAEREEKEKLASSSSALLKDNKEESEKKNSSISSSVAAASAEEPSASSVGDIDEDDAAPPAATKEQEEGLVQRKKAGAKKE